METVETEAGIYKRKQENTLLTKKKIKKESHQEEKNK